MPVIPQTRFEVLPMGEYNTMITSAALTEGVYGAQVEFLFTIEGGPHDGANIKHWTSAKFSPKSNLYALARAAFGGREIPDDYDLDTDHLAGRKVNIMLTIKIKPEDGSEFNKVDGVRVWREVPAVMPQQPTAPAAQQKEREEIPF